jgi:hypothetical protein
MIFFELSNINQTMSDKCVSCSRTCINVLCESCYKILTKELKEENSQVNMEHKSPTHEDCPICYDSFEKKNLVKTPCDHLFCRKCLEKFFASNQRLVCPLCRCDLSQMSFFKKLMRQHPRETEIGLTLESSEQMMDILTGVRMMQRQLDTFFQAYDERHRDLGLI